MQERNVVLIGTHVMALLLGGLAGYVCLASEPTPTVAEVPDDLVGTYNLRVTPELRDHYKKLRPGPAMPSKNSPARWDADDPLPNQLTIHKDSTVTWHGDLSGCEGMPELDHGGVGALEDLSPFGGYYLRCSAVYGGQEAQLLPTAVRHTLYPQTDGTLILIKDGARHTYDRITFDE